MNLAVDLAPHHKQQLQLRNPVMTGSGTFSNGIELAKHFEIDALGAVVSKGTTLRTRRGNSTPRTIETPSGMINAIGFQNIGVGALMRNIAPTWARWNVPAIVNVMGESVEEYGTLAKRLDGVDGVSAIELNVSCPNVDVGGLEFGQDPKTAAEVVSEAIRNTSLPLLVKLTPSITDIRPVVEAVTNAGAHAITVANTIPALAIDIEKRQAEIANGFGGLSGPAIRPITLRLVWQAASVTSLPIVASGGIANGKDAIEFLMAGATAVQVGTANFLDPRAPWRVLEELTDWCKTHEIQDVREIIGVAHHVD